MLSKKSILSNFKCSVVSSLLHVSVNSESSIINNISNDKLYDSCQIYGKVAYVYRQYHTIMLMKFMLVTILMLVPLVIILCRCQLNFAPTFFVSNIDEAVSAGQLLVYWLQIFPNPSSISRQSFTRFLIQDNYPIPLFRKNWIVKNMSKWKTSHLVGWSFCFILVGKMCLSKGPVGFSVVEEFELQFWKFSDPMFGSISL